MTRQRAAAACLAEAIASRGMTIHHGKNAIADGREAIGRRQRRRFQPSRDAETGMAKMINMHDDMMWRAEHDR